MTAAPRHSRATFDVLALRQPRKGIEGYLWFWEAPDAATAAAIRAAVPEAFTACAHWVAPYVLEWGTADDLDAWCARVGSWEELRQILAEFIDCAAELAPLAFAMTSAGPRLVDTPDAMTTRVVPVLRDHFARAPRNDGDPGTWTLYYLLAEMNAGRRGANRRGSERADWCLELVRASVGHDFGCDQDNVNALGGPALRNDNDPRVALLAQPDGSEPETLVALAARIVDDRSVSPEWFSRVVPRLRARAARPDEPTTSASARVPADPDLARRALAVVMRFEELGEPSQRLVAEVARCLLLSDDWQAREAFVTRYGRGRYDLLDAAHGAGREDVFQRQLDAVVVDARAAFASKATSEPPPPEALSIVLGALLAAGRDDDAGAWARDFRARRRSGPSNEDELSLLMQALRRSGLTAEEDGFASELDAYLTREPVLHAPFTGLTPLLVAAWHGRRGRHALAGQLAARALSMGIARGRVRSDPDLAAARALEPLASKLGR